MRKIFVSHAYRDAGLYHELIRALWERNHFRFQDVSVPDISLIDSQRPKTAIRNRIKKCQVMLVFTRPVATTSEYIQYELATAEELKKPIVGIKPPGDRYVSSVVRKRAKIIIDWDVEEIIRQVRKPGARPLSPTSNFDLVEDSETEEQLAPTQTPTARSALREIFSRAFGIGRGSVGKEGHARPLDGIYDARPKDGYKS